MTAALIDGRALAAYLYDTMRREVNAFEPPPGLAVIIVGDHAPSRVYVTGKVKTCAHLGIKSHVYELPGNATASELNTLIDTLNANDTVDGILLQLPLPAHLAPATFLERIDPRKDVDGLHPGNLGLLMSGRPRFVPCTPQGIMMLIHSVEGNIAGAHAVVVGRSVLVGKPVAQLLLTSHATVTQTHGQTRDLAVHTRTADILVVAAGSPGLITAAHVKPGAIVIDVGINRMNNALIGDVDFNTVKDIARAVTPVPGGVGPMTIACLMKNTLNAFKTRGC
jgi:methylenetetrahydrofolate dehydrogenase (NADP+)/methenyltetrahydrofolate cyclohydrolase